MLGCLEKSAGTWLLAAERAWSELSTVISLFLSKLPLRITTEK